MSQQLNYVRLLAAEDYGKWYIARLRLLNSTLEDGREFLCAGRFTLADICIVFALMVLTRRV